MLTLFGKFCRKLRIDTGELLKDMADKLNVTPSYLSAVETGKRNVPRQWSKLLSEKYNLDEGQRMELDKSIEDSQLMVKLDFQKFNSDERELIMAFAREFKDLDDENKLKIRDILKGNKKGV